MAKTEKTSKTKTVARSKVSKLEKALRKLSGTSAKTPFSMKTGLFTVTAFSQQPVEVPGYLIERSDLFTIWRHKATSASKKMVVSVYRNEDILEQLGDEKGGSITVMQRRVAASATGTLKFNGPDIIVKGDGGQSVFSDNENVQYEIKAADAEGSQASGRGAKSSDDEGKKKSGKVVAIDSGKKKKKK
uniref:Uncharacterized protein n=1 Tax=Pseudomonas phage HRDY3 TaxID=3236930 RepID=A0AB39CDY5_9VIRU